MKIVTKKWIHDWLDVKQQKINFNMKQGTYLHDIGIWADALHNNESL